MDSVKAFFAKAKQYHAVAASFVAGHPKTIVNVAAVVIVGSIVGKVLSFIF